MLRINLSKNGLHPRPKLRRRLFDLKPTITILSFINISKIINTSLIDVDWSL